MILEAISAALPMALGIALSPLPIAAVIMMLMTQKAKTNAPSFLLGWVIGLATVGVVIFWIPVDQSEKGDPTAIAGYIRIALGILLLAMAIRIWRNRPGPEDTVEVPTLLKGLDTFTGTKSLLTGFALVVLNVKNLPLCAAGAAAIDLVTQSTTEQFFGYMLFTVIASTSVAFPIVVYLAAKKRAKTLFDIWKAWLIKNNQTVVAVILLLAGAWLIFRGSDILMG